MVEVELSAVQTPTFVLFTTSFRSPAPPQRGTETHHLSELLYATSPSFEDSRPYSRHDQHDETTLETSFFSHKIAKMKDLTQKLHYSDFFRQLPNASHVTSVSALCAFLIFRNLL